MPRRDARIPKLAKLPSWEADCQELLYRFEEAVFTGAPMAFSTLRNLWQEMHFSFIFEVHLLPYNVSYASFASLSHMSGVMSIGDGIFQAYETARYAID